MEDPITLNALIALNVRELRQARGWTQDDLAVAAARAGLLGWGRGHIAAIESGARALSLGELFALGWTYNVSWHDLLHVPEEEDVEVVVVPGLSVLGENLPRLAKGNKDTPAITDREVEELTDAPSAHSQAEVKAARALDMELSALQKRALRLWGRSFVEERDARAAERVPVDATPRTTQAIRAHVTRELQQELALPVRKSRGPSKGPGSGSRARRRAK